MQIELLESTEVKQPSFPRSMERPVELGLATELSSTERQRWTYFAIKRALDVFMATVLLIAFAPIMVIVATMIRLDSPGPDRKSVV